MGHFLERLGNTAERQAQNAVAQTVLGAEGTVLKGFGNGALTRLGAEVSGAASNLFGVNTRTDVYGVGGARVGTVGINGQGGYVDPNTGRVAAVVNAGPKAAEMQQYIQATMDANQGIAGAREAAIAIARQHFTTTDGQGNSRVDFPNQAYTTGLAGRDATIRFDKVFPTPEAAFEDASREFARKGVGRAQSAVSYAQYVQPAPAQPAPVQSVQAAPAPVVATVPAPGATAVGGAPAVPAAPAAPAAPAPAAGPVTTKREIEGFTTTQEAPKDPEQVKARNTAIQNFVHIMSNPNNDKKIIEDAIKVLPKDVDVTKISYTVGDGSKNPDSSTTIKKFEVKTRLEGLGITPREPVVAGPAPADKPVAAAKPDQASAPASAAATTATAARDVASLSKAERQALQAAMEKEGFNTGQKPGAIINGVVVADKMDGIVGPKTKGSIKALAERTGRTEDQVVAIMLSGDEKQITALLRPESPTRVAAAPAPQAPAPAAPEIRVPAITADLVAPGMLTGGALTAGAAVAPASTVAAIDPALAREALAGIVPAGMVDQLVASANAATPAQAATADRAHNAALVGAVAQSQGMPTPVPAGAERPPGFIPYDPNGGPIAEQAAAAGFPAPVVAGLEAAQRGEKGALPALVNMLHDGAPKPSAPAAPAVMPPQAEVNRMLSGEAPVVMPSQKDVNSMLFGAPTFTPSGAPAAKPAPALATQLDSKAQQVQTGVNVASLDFNDLPQQNLPPKPVVPGQGTTRMG